MSVSMPYWFGHALRKPTPNITTQALTWKLQGMRKVGLTCNS